jgi:uncharacterized membrane protein
MKPRPAGQLQNWWQESIREGFLDRPRPNRLLPLDALRGLISILMALDHANGLIGGESSTLSSGRTFFQTTAAIPWLF